MVELKSCPFCNASPHRGKTKAERCQMHGETFQRYRIWCPHGCAEKNEINEAQATTAWNTRSAEARIAQLEDALRRCAEPMFVSIQDLPNYDQPNGWRDIAVERFEIAKAALKNAGGSE